MATTISAGCASRPQNYGLIGIGAQLYTVRAALEGDLLGTLKAVAALGYTNVELANLAGVTPEVFSDALRQIGLKPVGFHGDWRLIKNDPARAVEQAKTVGAPTLVMAWMPPEERVTLDHWRAWADHANRACELAKAAGLRFAWHNHDFEFKAIDGKVPFDLLVESFSPDIKFEVDVYWAALAGVDPLALMSRLTGRVTMLHIKDMARTGNPRFG
jgi:sugar phosphate isomerase/epimerase